MTSRYVRFNVATPDLSNSWTSLSGYTLSDIPTIADWTEKAYGQRMEDIRAIITEIFARDVAAGDGEYTITTKSGEPRNWDFISAPLGRDPDGRRLVLSMATDVTERKQAEQDVAQLAATLEATQKMVKLGSWSFDIATQIPTWSDLMFVVFGLNKEDGVPSFAEHQKIWHPDDWETFDKAVQECAIGKSYNLVVRILFPDGSYHYVNTQGFPRYDDEGNISELFGVSQDITEEKLEEFERIGLEAQLHQAQKLEAIGTMVGGISHELNNVLQSIFLYGGLVQSQLPENEKLKTNFGHVLNGAKKARDIVKQILTFSRKTNIDMRPQAIHEIVLETLSLERASLPANIDIKQDIDMNGELVLCDQTQITQIMINLCNNAQHAMEEKGGTLAVSLKQVRASIGVGNPTTAVLELKVSDTGHGIDPLDLEKIFDPFFTTKQLGRGTGLGLSVIHGIVEIMEGEITVTSEVGKGTTFYILLPVADEIKEVSTQTPIERAAVNHSVLLVDDEDSIRIPIQTVLLREGFKVDSAKDGKHALELFKANPGRYDLIVTDLSMPKLSGTDLTKEIRILKSEVPIILSTGRLGVADQKEFKDIGVTAFIQKPWTANELIEQILKLEDN